MEVWNKFDFFGNFVFNVELLAYHLSHCQFRIFEWNLLWWYSRTRLIRHRLICQFA